MRAVWIEKILRNWKPIVLSLGTLGLAAWTLVGYQDFNSNLLAILYATPISKPAAVSPGTSAPISTPVPTPGATELPAGADDEVSVAIQAYLNKNYAPLNLLEAKVVKGLQISLSDRTYVFATAFRRIGAAGIINELLLLVQLEGRRTVSQVILLSTNTDYRANDPLLKYEFNGYIYDAVSDAFIELGPLLHRMKTGEVTIADEGEWRRIFMSTEIQKDLLTGDRYINLLAYKDIIVPTAQPTAAIVKNPPLEQPESLFLNLDPDLLTSINTIEISRFPPNTSGTSSLQSAKTVLVSYEGRAETLIGLMGVAAYPELPLVYRAFFDTRWGSSSTYQRVPFINKQGLGSEIYDRYNSGLDSIDVGFFYGYVNKDGGYLILQINPDNSLNPIDHPEAFIALHLGPVPSHFGLRYINEFGRVEEFFPVKGNHRARIGSQFGYWSLRELQDKFGLQRGSLISTSGLSVEGKFGKYTPNLVFLHVNEYPSEEAQRKGGYKLVVWE